jgi:hypothetical protein
MTDPWVAVSNPARQCISVDSPEPDGSIIAVNEPALNSTLTPSSARKAVSALPHT